MIKGIFYLAGLFQVYITSPDPFVPEFDIDPISEDLNDDYLAHSFNSDSFGSEEEDDEEDDDGQEEEDEEDDQPGIEEDNQEEDESESDSDGVLG
ncbi:hypothetical protein PIB30_035896 [Stylosanthes scabra]|uniref:Uncharacterized protein n=1 Tax=Stylosanthes scabra TaxID=79078 RepID=A0ABU6VC81_9FABA|nr:hypothetical protein [Stylosanthes scabra]